MTASLPPFLSMQVERFYRRRGFKHPNRPAHPFWYSLHDMGPDSVKLQSNDYLGLAGHPYVRDAAVTALMASEGGGVMSQVFFVGRHEGCEQRRFETRLGEFVGPGSGILCQSGYDANVGLLQAVATRGMPVYIDQYAHASLYQGIHAAEAAPVRVRHNDMEDLRDKLIAGGAGVIVVDSVYSVSGSRSPLRKVAELAGEFGCLLVVDESHSLGTHGPQGRGLVHELGLVERVHVVTASLAKAFAARAGFIACDESLTEYLRFTAFPTIFSTALLPHELAPLHATLDVVMRDEERRQMLWHNVREVRGAIEAAGYDISNGSEQIVGLRCGPVRSAVRFRDALESRGVFGSLFWYPATEWQQSVLRLSVNSRLQQADIMKLADVMKAVREELDGDMPLLAAKRRRPARPQALATSIG
ncbi:quorum-sensing autoinducer CAI-1 synthase [Pelomonas sp. P7]|uniref:Quorum-sensing autoinducer CAI-1 synthase n=1 Tax=Pelomonas caseinilytica TaxID=2906763 RepID=A0ABS8XD59_9BURK|nr:alpha-hydroxyketone-type quorum-sensing autoinducer synthase [Pelomonas sp. P7]MCE4536324.1 quorum-sensing autoinducer CAI-1 synthase [Pelomonas sp. P7]